MDLAIIMLIGFVSLLNLVLAYVCLLHRKSQTEVFLAVGLGLSVVWNADYLITSYSRKMSFIVFSDTYLFTFSILFAYVIYLFLYSLRSQVKLNNILIALPGLYSAVIFALILAVKEFVWSEFTIADSGPNSYMFKGAGATHYAMYYTVMLGLIIYASLKPGHRPEYSKAQVDSIRFSLLGLTLFIIPVSVILPIFFDITDYIFIGHIGLALFTFRTVQAVTTGHVTTAKPQIIRFLAFATTAFAIAIVYLFIGYSATKFIASRINTEAFIIYSMVISVAIGLLFHPLEKLFDKLTSSFFMQTNYTPKKVRSRIHETLADEASLAPMTTKLSSILEQSLNVSHVSFVTDNNTRSILNKFSLNHNGLVMGRDQKETKGNKYLKANDIAFSCRLEIEDEIIGYINFGTKNNGNLYSSDDFDFIKSISTTLALAIKNAQRYEEIKNFNNTLQNKVDKATNNLRVANRKLKSLDKAKDEFFSMASHQLRSPVSATSQAINLLRHGQIDNQSFKDELLATAEESSERTVSLVKDMFSTAKLTTGVLKVKKNETNITRLLEARIRIAQNPAKVRNQQIKLIAPKKHLFLEVDSAAIREVTANFLDNAIKYSPNNSEITTKLSTDKQGISITITDQGIGVPAEDQALLFTMFFRASNAIDSREGTGLGLFLAKQIIELHDGEIIFESKPGEGSTFGFRVPRGSEK